MEKDFYSMEELNSLFNALDDHQNTPPARDTIPNIDIPVGDDAPVEPMNPVERKLTSKQTKEAAPSEQHEPLPIENVFNSQMSQPQGTMPEQAIQNEPETTTSEMNSDFGALATAMQQYAAGNYDTAANNLAVAAVNEEDYRAARMLGDMIDFGEVDNMGTAADWYVRSMAIYQMQEMEDNHDNTGYRLNLYRLAMCYALGNGVSKKNKRALSMLEKAGLLGMTPDELFAALQSEKLNGEKSEHLEPDAEELLAISELMLMQHSAGEKVTAYVQAAERKLLAGNMPAADVLGQLYFMQGNCQMYGYGCVKNTNLGRAFWQEAARLGYPEAESALNHSKM